MKTGKDKFSGPLVLAVLDGWGVGPRDTEVNALWAAKTPFIDHARVRCAYTELEATGVNVGLEENQLSGSETGHMNIGAGRIVDQDARIILESVNSGLFFRNRALFDLVNHIKKNNSKVHLLGLIGPQDSSHTHPDIFLSLLIFLKQFNIQGKVFFHLFTDGRDSYPNSALEHWQEWRKMSKITGVGTVATLSGRFYAMDRVKRYERTMRAYNAMVLGEGEKFSSIENVVCKNYRRGNSDEYLEPAVIVKEGKPVAKIEDNDAVLFFNLRSDRARQMAKLFVINGEGVKKEKNFPKRDKVLNNLYFLALTNFGPDLNLETAFSFRPVKKSLPEVLSSCRQLYISEAEKFSHITYFFNGGEATCSGGEERLMINSPKTRSYAEKPEMSAKKIRKEVVKRIKKNMNNFIAVNFANTDMVGHTGNFSATVKAAEVVDDQLKRIYKEVVKKDGAMIITSDHGNADVMFDKKNGRIFNFHTKNPVPFMIASNKKKHKKGKLKLEGGVLGNIAPTILEILGVDKPKEMTLDSLIKK